MKMADQKQEIIWLLRPEDSSSAETGSSEQDSISQNRPERLYAFIKVSLCYAAALTVTLFLARLH